MTLIKIELPDELAERASQAGLLSDQAIGELLENAMRRQAGRALIEISRRIHAAGIPRLNEAEIVAEVKAARADRRSHP